jgi:glycosyltransferase involved in cell wall biosynthesis
MRVFIGLTEVSGYFSRLRQGFEQLGIEAVHVPLQAHKFAYSTVNSGPIPVRLAQYAVSRRVASSESLFPVRLYWLGMVIFTRLFLFVWALIRFDAYVLGAGSSFFSFVELPLLKILKKKVIYTLHGTDARPPYIDGFFDPAQYGISSDAELIVPASQSHMYLAHKFAASHQVVAIKRKKQVKIIEDNVRAVICGSGYSHFLEKPFVNFYVIGLPLDMEGQLTADTSSCGVDKEKRVRILHAPSEQKGKGSVQIRAVIDNLKKKGLPIEYSEISGRPNSEVLIEIGKCDLVIDQLYSDSPMAGFASEAAFLGKPAIVSGYYSIHVASHVPVDAMPPTAFCLPNDLEGTVQRLVSDHIERESLGRVAHEFVSERWSAKAVASKFVRLFEGDIDPTWMFDPARMTYLHGIGLSEQQARANVAAVIAHGGVSALQLSHRPDLECKFVEFAAGIGSEC